MNSSSDEFVGDATIESFGNNSLDTSIVIGRACLSVLCAITFLACMIFIAGIALNKHVRSQGFNVYLITLVIPDAMVNGIEVVKNAYYTRYGGYEQITVLCRTRMWVCLFYYVTNLWLNAILAHEIYVLVWNSFHRKKSQAPPPKKVYIQAGCVYLFATLWATWIIIDAHWSPGTFDNRCGMDFEGGVFGKTSALALFFSILLTPMVYVACIGARIWWGKLLPVAGRTRALCLYFLRITLVFACFYFPGIIFALLTNVYLSGNEWFYCVHTALFPMQAIVTLALSISKPDVRMAVMKFLHLGKCRQRCCPGLGKNTWLWDSLSAASLRFSSTSSRDGKNTMTSALSLWRDNSSTAREDLETTVTAQQLKADTSSFWNEIDDYGSRSHDQATPSGRQKDAPKKDASSAKKDANGSLGMSKHDLQAERRRLPQESEKLRRQSEKLQAQCARLSQDEKASIARSVESEITGRKSDDHESMLEDPETLKNADKNTISEEPTFSIHTVIWV